MRTIVSIGALLLLYLLLSTCVSADIDDKVLSKDLYGALGVSKEASASEIKRAYRNLARKFHPDKAKNDDQREDNERKFVEIAEAHEILSDESLRQEYDYYLKFSTEGHGRDSKRSSGGQPDTTRKYDIFQGGPGESFMFQGGSDDIFGLFEGFLHASSMDFMQRQYQHQEFAGEYDMFDMFAGEGMFEREPQNAFSQHSQFQPTITESPLRSNEIITPYSPILVSADRTEYSFLDEMCSYKVLSYTDGGIGDFVQILIENPISYHEVPGMHQRYSTPQFPSLDGDCFAAVDESGAFSVFQGHPQFGYKTLWTTIEWNDGDEIEYQKSLEKRHFLHLMNDGELTVISLPGRGGRARQSRSRGDDSEDDRPSKTWSSRDYSEINQVSSKTKHMLRMFIGVTLKLISTTIRFMGSIPRCIDRGLDMLDELGPLETTRVILTRSLYLCRRFLLQVFA